MLEISSKEMASDENTITVGKYVILNRNKFSKLHLLTENSSVNLGKEKIELNGIIGQLFWSTFKLVQNNRKDEYSLELCTHTEVVESNDMSKYKSGGQDNRNIWDDGNSQQLSTEEITQLKDRGLSSQAIVERLIKNSNTFHSKTEYSQEKYLKKKGSKYFEYLLIKKPTIRLLAELFFTKDPSKILGLRIDSLSQIITAVNLQPNGRYILYENGSQGLVAATMLNYLSNEGKLIYITPGKHAQKHAVLAMNFTEKVNQMKCIQLTAFMEKSEALGESSGNASVTLEKSGQELKSGNLKNVNCDDVINEEGKGVISDECQLDSVTNLQKRKNNENEYEGGSNAKKPRWELDAEEAMDLINSKNNDGIVIVCKEYPLNLLLKLFQFVSPSRPFVVFSLYREELSQLYVQLKSKHNIVNLRLSETWLRTYQVLPDRTHPHVLMRGNSGYILTGIVVNNE